MIDMPWATIITALLSFFLMKRNGASNTKAAVVAGLAGAGTYYVSHETDWGRANLGALDGVPPEGGSATDVDGQPVVGEDGRPIVTGGNTGGTSFWDVLRGWGGTGTAAVIGTGAAAAGTGVFNNKYIPWILGGVALILIMK